MSEKTPLKFAGVEYVEESLFLSKIDESEFQPTQRKKSLEEETLSQQRADLIEHVAQYGQLERIDVYPQEHPGEPMRFVVIEGHGRVAALRKAERKTVLARVYKVTSPEDVTRIRDAIIKAKSTESKFSGGSLVDYIYRTLPHAASLAERKEGAKRFREAAETIEFVESAFDEPEFGDMVAGKHETGPKQPLSPDMLKSARTAAKILLDMGSYDRLVPDRNPTHRETLIRALRWVYQFEMTRAVVDYRKNLDRRGPSHLKNAVRDWRPLDQKVLASTETV
jgi:hypothetical protein